MASTARCCFVLLILGAGVRVEGLWNFRAVGEYLSVDVDDCNQPFSVDSTRYFEEVYFSDGVTINKTALRIDSQDVDAAAFFGDLKGGKVFLQLGSEDCKRITENDSDLPPVKAWSFESEAVYAPIYITLTELKYLFTNGTEFEERGLPALRAELDLTDKSDPKYNVEQAFLTFEEREDGAYDYEGIVPLSIQLCIVNNGTRTIERLSIVEFAWNTTSEEDASPPAGTRCDEYGRPFSSDIFNASTLVLRTEQVLNGSVTTGDIAVDFDRKLLRIDNGVNDYFLSTSQKLIYNVTNPDSRIQDCKPLKSNEVPKLEWSFADFSVGSAKDFFGVNENFKIKTRTKRRGIECDLISGTRDYLPEKGTLSVWEWCVGEMSTADGLKQHLVHLDISIRPVGGPLYQESYSLYDVQRNIDQRKLYLDYFTELEPCSGLADKMSLQVIVDGRKSSSYSDDDIETAIESGLFRAVMLNTMLKESGLKPDSYRFGSTEAYILDSRDAVFQFALLGAPENSPEDQRVEEIFKKLQKTVSESDLTVDVNGIKFSIRKDSLTEAHEMGRGTTPPPPVTEPSKPPRPPTPPPVTEPSKPSTPPPVTEPHRPPTPPPVTEPSKPSTPPPITEPHRPPTPDNPSELTSPEPDTPTTEKNNSHDLPEVTEGYQGALVWGVAFAVLLFGGGVGVVAGNKLLIK